MSVVYDLLGFQSREHGERGIARFVLQLALALERTNPGLVNQYLMHPQLPFPSGAEPLIATGRVVRSDRWHPVRAPSAGGVFVAGSPFEDFHFPSDLVFPPWARSPRWRIVAVLHDLIPQKFPELYLKTSLDRHNYQARLSAVGSLDWLLANSEVSAQDAAELLGFDRRHVTVIGAGADTRFRPSPLAPEEVAAELARDERFAGLRPGYLFFPTGLDPRKNIERTIAAYGQLPAEFRRRHQLVLTCRLGEHGRRYLTALADAAGVTDDLLATGYVHDDDLRRLYQGAHLVIFPSLYEGFGLPVLEAMRCRAAVIVADSSSLREVQTIEEARFDPSSVDSISAAMRRVLGDDELLGRLRSQELPAFSWESAADLAAGAIEGLLADVRVRAASPGVKRSRLALVGTLPPDPGSSATHAYRLAEELRHHCEVSVFVDADPSQIDPPLGVTVAPIGHLDLMERGGGAFDRILYVLGSGPGDVAILRALRERPGWVLLHDVHLTELYRHLHDEAPGELVGGSVGTTLAYNYPGRYRANVEAMETIPRGVAERFGILLARDVAASAERLLVHSGYEASLLELDTGAAPIVVGPQPCPPVVSADRHDPTTLPVISSFGSDLELAQAEILFQALGVVRDAVPGTRLRLVGQRDARLRDELIACARQAGVADAVELVVLLDDQRQASAQAETMVAVQLQRQASGVAAIAVADLLAAGVPTVVADVGPSAELPDDVVVKFDPAGSAAELGELLTMLLEDREGRLAISQSAKDYAKANSYSQTAEALAQIMFD